MQYTPQSLQNTEVNLRQYAPQDLLDTTIELVGGVVLLSPANGATGVSKTPNLSWESFGSSLYRLRVWDDDGSGGAGVGQPDTLITEVRLSGTDYTIPTELQGSSWYHWAVMPSADITPSLDPQVTGVTISEGTTIEENSDRVFTISFTADEGADTSYTASIVSGGATISQDGNEVTVSATGAIDSTIEFEVVMDSFPAVTASRTLTIQAAQVAEVHGVTISFGSTITEGDSREFTITFDADEGADTAYTASLVSGGQSISQDGNTVTVTAAADSFPGTIDFQVVMDAFPSVTASRELTIQEASAFTPDNSLQGQMDALNQLYTDTTGASWTDNTGWPIASTGQMGDAYGIDVDGSGNVITVNLYDNNLNGSLPEIIGNLTFLQFWSVKNNSNIYSEIPDSIRYWTNIQTLLFSSDQSTSEYNVPPNNNIHQGKTESASRSKYFGTLPDVFDQMPDLEIFEIAWSLDMDAAPYPSTLYQHSNLRILSLNGINLTGELSDTFNLPNIEVLFISNNHLSGNLPASLSNSTKLEKLGMNNSNWFDSNHATVYFTGPIPSEWSALVSMQRIYLFNQDLSGEIPGFIVENWTGLREFMIDNNSFTGEIPAEFGNFDITILSVSQNNFTGSIDVNLVSGMQRIIIFNVYDNNLSGTVPNGEMVNGEWRGWRTKQRLRTVWMQDNNFSGPLFDMPTYVGDMSVLALHRNNFEGGIPETWEELFTPALRNVNPSRTFDNLQMRGNELQGIMPSWFTNANIDGTVDVKGNRWCHRDILENGVSVSVGEQHDAPQLPFGQVENIEVASGGTFTFDYSHKIHATDSIQWYYSGQPISGQTSEVLTIENVDPSDNGEYTVRLTNTGTGLPNTIESEIINLTVT